ncbi:MAG: GIY-YIG nuclease family protein [Verrucomicrobiales bacterium]|nr:GIY-YIG nuclease family protein [Verrucomicrobiales bacterium]
MSTPTPKTIQIFLPGGDPRGIRVAEITTRIVQVIEVPRSLLGDFLKMPESDQVAVYFLFGQSEETGEPRVYIGQTGDLRSRLKAHHDKKDFWERAAVLISRTNSLTQTHALFLEWHCLQAVRKAGRYGDENGNSGTKPHTPAPLEADCLEIYETGHTLLATLGFPIFDPVAKPVVGQEAEEIFYCNASGAEGRGQYTEEGFVVLKGSKGRAKSVPSFVGGTWHEQRERMIEVGEMKIEGEALIVTKDLLFPNPSKAAAMLMGRSANGWIDWKTQDGRTLDAVKRQNP